MKVFRIAYSESGQGRQFKGNTKLSRGEFERTIGETIQEFKRMDHNFTIEDIWNTLKDRNLVEESHESVEYYEVLL